MNQQLYIKIIQGLNKKMNRIKHQVCGQIKDGINTRANQLYRY